MTNRTPQEAASEYLGIIAMGSDKIVAAVNACWDADEGRVEWEGTFALRKAQEHIEKALELVEGFLESIN